MPWRKAEAAAMRKSAASTGSKEHSLVDERLEYGIEHERDR
jgi:hypothetical protein